MENLNSLKSAESNVLAEEAVKLLSEKLALNIKMFDVRTYTSVTDFYVNCTGKSGSHVLSLADDVADYFSDREFAPLRVEGKQGNSWILVDFGQIIVNIFDSESRGFYSFDRLLPPETEREVDALILEVDKKLGRVE